MIPKKISVFNIGCKVNQYECDCIQSALESFGICTSSHLDFSDIYIINTCAVTAEAERKSRQIISRVKKINPDCDIVITGCAAEKNPSFYLNAGACIITGVLDKNQLIENILRHISHPQKKRVYNIKPHKHPLKYEEISSFAYNNKSRTFIKIQDGCDNFCSYCAIPYFRGGSRSRTIENVMKELISQNNSVKEVVLTGINLASYGQDNEESLNQLIEQLYYLPYRIRIGSFYVEGINEKLLEALSKMNNFCPHFHLSLQSCSDQVLADMGRRYKYKDIEEKISLIRSFFPISAISSDIIVGYPTESEDNFQDTYIRLKHLGLSFIHVFPFSKRENTKAFELLPIKSVVMKNRKESLIKLGKEIEKSFLEKMLFVEQNVIFEEREDSKTSKGYSEYYIKVYSDAKKNIAKIKPTELFKDGLKGVEIG